MSAVKHIIASTCWLLAAAGAYGQNQRGVDMHEHHQAEHVAAVFDANGAYVGTIDALDAVFGVNMTINGAVVFVKIQRLSNDDFSNASASQFRWMATDCTTESNCTGVVPVSCGGALCPARPSMAIRRGTAVTLYIASPSNSTVGNPFNPQWAPEATYDLTLHHPEPLTVRY
ncbi:hypothetical protein [Paraburkholderia sp. ZP32-5]|uniref:hypothetical protein n=1 Tax=Paraburkholderia sp. ZP32-5 TaxID=2883245 RepID=UPI001F29DD69|nr:hypothetical protein [Paraburkholderia sp. ZP32-5]